MAVGLDEVMADARDAVRVVSQRAPVRSAFLFGSYVQGRADGDSDVDLAVFVEGAEAWGLRERVDLACLVQREVGDHIELHVFPASALRRPEPASFAAYVQKNGLELHTETAH